MKEKTLNQLVGWIVIWFVLSVVIYFMTYFKTESFCLSEGYKYGRIDIFLNDYCVKRVNQTDVVVPVYKIKDGSDVKI